MKIPSNNQWTQTNQGDISGVVHDTHNISFDREGKAKLSAKPFAFVSSETDADLSTPLAIAYYASNYYVITDDEVFTFNLYTSGMTEISGTPALSTNADLEVVFSRLYATADSNLYYWNGATWSSSVETLTASVPHPMAVFDSQTTYKLAVGNGNTVKLIDSSGNASASVLTLASQFQVNTITYRNGYLYVGTENVNGGEARIFIWDGDTNNANYEVPVGGSIVYSVIPYKGTVAALVDTGELLLISGTSAQRLAAFPIYYQPDMEWSGTSDFTGRVMHRGMVAVGDNIYISVDGQLRSGFMPEMKSGLWVYDPMIGLYHRAAFSNDLYVDDNTLSVTDSVITTTANHSLKTGDVVEFRSVSGLSGVAIFTPYYVKVESANTIKLALSRKALEAGNYITITGTATSDSLIYAPNTDFDAGFEGRPGAVCRTAPLELQFATWNTPVIWGGRGTDADGNSVDFIMALQDSYNIGRLETQRIYSDNIEQDFQEVTSFVDGLVADVEEFIVKYRIDEKQQTEVLKGIWGSENTIHADTSLFTEDEWRDIEKGYELVIVDGYGRGYSCHVTNVNDNSATVVLTVDESIGTLNKPVYFYATNYKKLKAHTNGRKSKAYVEDSISKPGSWIQIKVEMRGYGTELAMFDLENSKKK